MSENDMAQMILEAFETAENEDGEPLHDTMRIDSFEGAGLMSRETGLVFTMNSGETFQVTIKRSR